MRTPRSSLRSVKNWTEFRLRSSLQQPASQSAEHNDIVKAIPPDRTVPMPGKMARSAPLDHPFGLPEGAGSRPHLASVFQGRRKSNNIHASSGVIWGIPAKIPAADPARTPRHQTRHNDVELAKSNILLIGPTGS